MGEETGNGERDVVSREAHDRIVRERDQLKAQNVEATKALAHMKRVDDAYRHFRGIEGITDPYGAAQAAARDSLLEGVDGDDLPGKLDEWLTTVQSFTGGPPPAAPDDDETTPTPVAPPPGSARPAPSPGGSGGQPKPEPLTWGSPEVQEMRRKGDRAGLHDLVRSGRLQLSPNNPLRDRIQQG